MSSFVRGVFADAVREMWRRIEAKDATVDAAAELARFAVLFAASGRPAGDGPDAGE